MFEVPLKQTHEGGDSVRLCRLEHAHHPWGGKEDGSEGRALHPARLFHAAGDIPRAGPLCQHRLGTPMGQEALKTSPSSFS